MSRRVQLGSTILAVGALGLFAASAAILLTDQPDPSTRVGRHLWAGALAIACLAVQELVLALIPLRRGDRWALWAAAVPFILVGAPVLYLDATYVQRSTWLWTLMPQLISQLIGLFGLFLCAGGVDEKKHASGA